jgi:hypothetical protein
MIPGTQMKRALDIAPGDVIVYHRNWVRVRYTQHDWVDQYYRVVITLVTGVTFSLTGDDKLAVKQELAAPAS